MNGHFDGEQPQPPPKQTMPNYSARSQCPVCHELFDDEVFQFHVETHFESPHRQQSSSSLVENGNLFSSLSEREVLQACVYCFFVCCRFFFCFFRAESILEFDNSHERRRRRRVGFERRQC